MISYLAQLGVLLLCAIGSIDGNTDWPASPTAYTVVCFPANYQTDPLCQDIIKGFQTDETLKELRSRTKLWTYTENHPDYKHRWAARIAELPTVIIMDGEEVVYKRSKADAKTIAADIRGDGTHGGGFFNRFPKPCKPDDPCYPKQPNSPNRPDNRPNSPNRPPQNRPTPDSPSNPSRPLIPDTAPNTTPKPDPFDAALNDKAIKELSIRIDQLEAKIKVLTLADGKQGPAGRDGKDGINGKDGANGKDATVDYTLIQANIQKWALENKTKFGPTIQEVVAALPPITFERLDQTGRVLDAIDVHLGKKAKFPPLTVNYLGDSGKIIDTEYVPLGGILNLRIEVEK